MSALTGIVAGLATAAGAFAVFRLAERKTREIRSVIDEVRRRARSDFDGAVIDYERDPESGVFKPKQ